MVKAETTMSYFQAMKSYLTMYGKPRAIYTDKHVVFKVNNPGGFNTTGLTQFGRALKQLGIEAIFAHSPEAKGRVERANNTLQDRLIKDFRYFNISNISQANEFMKSYIKSHNDKFAVEPQSDINLHTPLSNREEKTLDNILACQRERVINKNLIIKHNNISYQLSDVGKGHKFKGRKAIVNERIDGTVEITCHGTKLKYKIFGQAQYKPSFANRKEIDRKLDIQRNWFLLNKRINQHGDKLY